MSTSAPQTPADQKSGRRFGTRTVILATIVIVFAIDIFAALAYPPFPKS